MRTYQRERHRCFSRFSCKGLVLITVLGAFLICSLGGVASAANSTVAGVVTARAADATSILVTMPYSGDDNGDNTYMLQWKLCTDVAYPLENTINGGHSASPFAATIPGLTESTCYTIKATYNDADTVSGTNPQEIKITSTWDTTLLHNRNRFMTSTKWDAEGGWGLPGTKYGQFGCETCHTNSRTDTNINIKRILSPITAPSGTFPGSTVVFRDARDGSSDFGNDLGGHTTSDKICEACHSITDFHRYNTNADPDGAGPLGPQVTLEHNNNTDCTICHKHNAGFNIVGGTCTTCHGDPPPPLAGKDGTSGNATGSLTAGTHRMHATSLSVYYKNYPCETCHDGSVGSGATHNNNKITMGFKIFGGAYTSGTYDGQTTANYQGSVPAPGPGSGAKTCSNIYCHGSTMAPNGGSNTTPSWDDSPPNSVFCGTCHGYFFPPPARGSHTFHSGPGPTGRGLGCNDCHYGLSPTSVPSNLATHVNNQADFAFDPSKVFSYIGLSATYDGTLTMLDAYGNCSNLYCHSNVQPDGGTGAYTGVSVQWGAAGPLACSTSSCHGGDTDPDKIATGSHTKHVTTSTYNFGCATCHNAGGHGTTKHADYAVDISFLSGGAYSGTPTPGNIYGGCVLYCHSSGQGPTANDANPVYQPAAWGNAASGACGKCHETTTGTTLGQIDTGGHTKHLSSGATCESCHTEAGSGTDSYTTGNHVNHLIDVSNGYTAGGAPGNGYGTCSTSCHSDGTATTGTSPTWGQSMPACTTCHALQPATQSHTKHLTGLTIFADNANCGNCHDGAVQGTTAIAGRHPDANVDVYDVNPGDLGYPPINPIGNPLGNCTTAYCHSDGKGNYRSATWGGATTGCNFCHDNPPATGAHNLHANAATGYGSTAVGSTDGDYEFGCGNCHPASTSNHGNGTVDISLNPADGGTLKSKNSGAAEWNGSTCTGVYCHSDGKGTLTIASPPWTGTFGGDRCAGCHLNSPDSTSHGAHVVGIHYDNVFSGTTGLAAAGSGLNSSHGNGDSTTINCNVCHNSTVTSAANALNTICAACHTDQNTPSTGNAVAAIARKALHVNGAPDITFAAINVKSRAQVRDSIVSVPELGNNWNRTAYKSGTLASFDTAQDALAPANWNSAEKGCSSVACHNGYYVKWTDTVSCSSCHKALP